MPNIGPRQRRARLVFAAGGLAVALLLGVVLVLTETPRPLRLAVFVPLWLAALGYFQAREKT